MCKVTLSTLSAPPFELSGRGGVGCVLVRNLPSPREGEGQGVRAGG